MRIALFLTLFTLIAGCSHQKSSARAPSSVGADSCHDLIASLVSTDWRELWDQQIAKGIDSDEAIDWVKRNQELSGIVKFSKSEDREPLEHSYALIHARNPDWSADQVATHYKLWQTSCGL